MNLFLILAVLSSFLTQCFGGNILFVLPFGTRSHLHMFSPLMEELASRNHQVTFVSMMESSKSIPNVETVVIASGKNFSRRWSEWASSVTSNTLSLGPMKSYLNEMDIACEEFYADPTFHKFRDEVLRNNSRYDVVLTMAVLSECYLPWIGTLGAPLIIISPCVVFQNTAWILDIPYPLSYISSPVTPFNSTMTFRQRIVNFLASYFYFFVYNHIIIPNADASAKKSIPNVISAYDVLKNVSLMLVNSHFSLDEPKPTTTNVIDVGGMHCQPGKVLPKVFEEFVNSSGDDGFIVMSMGSVVHASKISKDFIQLFITTFSKVKQKVIWKFEESVEGLSPNVMISNWIPQQDLMAHPKCRLAITHGGLLSLQEVAYHGVPLLGVPLGADRDFNINHAVNKGFALLLDWKEASVEEALGKINALIYDEKYKNKALEMSFLTRDRPDRPVDTAAYWVEYVIRHKGAPHLKNIGVRQLNLIQYLGIDVLLFIFVIVMAALLFCILIIRFLAKLLISLGRSSKLKKH